MLLTANVTLPAVADGDDAPTTNSLSLTSTECTAATGFATTAGAGTVMVLESILVITAANVIAAMMKPKTAKIVNARCVPRIERPCSRTSSRRARKSTDGGSGRGVGGSAR